MNKELGELIYWAVARNENPNHVKWADTDEKQTEIKELLEEGILTVETARLEEHVEHPFKDVDISKISVWTIDSVKYNKRYGTEHE